MAKLKQIAKRLLPHSATLVRKSGGGAWTDPETTEYALEHIRIDGRSELTYSKDGKDVKCSMTLIFDCVNSKPLGMEFRFEDVVEWRDTKYTVVALNPISTDTRNLPIHHWEVGLA